MSWKHYTVLISLNNQKERQFYETKIIINSWSVREFKEQIKNYLYQKTDDKEIEDVLKNKLSTVANIQKIFKSDSLGCFS